MKSRKSKCLFTICAFSILLMSVFMFDMNVYAATSGSVPCSSGSVSWTLDDKGVLTFSGSGTTNIDSIGWEWYWYDEALDKSAVTSVQVEPDADIIVNRTDGMFYNFTNCKSISLRGIDTSKATDTSEMFSGCNALTDLDTSTLNTSNAKNMDCMFYNCKSLTTLDISTFNTSNVTDMRNMFYGCESLRELNIDNLDTSNVTNMNSMFYNCKSIKTLDLSDLETNKVTDMGDMFANCEKLVSIDINTFKTNNVTNMESMFQNCVALTELDLSHFDTSKVTTMACIFEHCNSLTKLNVTGFNTEKVTSLNHAFCDCSSLEQLDLSTFNTANVTNMEYLFTNCKALKSLDINHFNVSNVENMISIFGNCSSLTTLDLSNWETSKLTKVEGYSPHSHDGLILSLALFENCSSLQTLKLSKFDTSNITTMLEMFTGCESLVELDLSSFDTSNVTTMYKMFEGCESLVKLDLSSFDTSNVTSMKEMFDECESLTTLDITGFDTTNVTNMCAMFNKCISIKELDLSNFNTQKVTSMSHMFYECESLTDLNISNFNTSNVETMYEMFYACKALSKLDVSSFNTSKAEDMFYMFAHCNSLKTLDLSSFDTKLADTNGNAITLAGNSLEKVISPKTDSDLEIRCGNDKIIYDDKGNFYGTSFWQKCKALTEFYIVPNMYSIKYVYTGELVGCPDKYHVENGQSDLGSVVAEHYTFDGWYTDNTYQTKVTEIKQYTVGEVTLYAKMIPETYSIIYKNIEPAINLENLPTNYPYNIGVELPELESTCYSFEGWYEDEELTKKITAVSNTSIGSVTVYAKWIPVHEFEMINAVAPTCTEDGYTGEFYCNTCDKEVMSGSVIPKLNHKETIVKNDMESSCAMEGYTGDTHCKFCDLLMENGEVIPKKEHDIDMNHGTIKTKPTATSEGEMEYKCKNCNYTIIKPIGKIGVDFVKENSIPEDTLAITDEKIAGLTNDNDIKGSSFVRIQAKSGKVTKNSISLSWNKVKNADGYKIYGNKCGKKNRYKQIKNIKNGNKTKFTQKKCKKGTYYKYIVKAYKLIDGEEVTIAASKTIHVTTAGGKYGNVKSVKLKTGSKLKKKSKQYVLKLKKKKTFKIKSSEVKESKKIKRHRKIAYESSDINIASVDKKGVVKGKAKGTCYIYVYAQNGVYTKIKVTVK